MPYYNPPHSRQYQEQFIKFNEMKSLAAFKHLTRMLKNKYCDKNIINIKDVLMLPFYLSLHVFEPVAY